MKFEQQHIRPGTAVLHLQVLVSIALFGALVAPAKQETQLPTCRAHIDRTELTLRERICPCRLFDGSTRASVRCKSPRWKPTAIYGSHKEAGSVVLVM